MQKFVIPTIEDIVARYSNLEGASQDELIEARQAELKAKTKDELIDIVIEKEKAKKTDTVQELAKAILQDEEFIAADYETIASAIREIKPEAKTSSKSIASYVSKKRDEWDLPVRVRITKPRAPKVVEATEAPEAESETTEAE